MTQLYGPRVSSDCQDIDSLADRLIAGDRRALARAITLVESTKPVHRERALALLQRVARAGSVARRIGLSGTPGVGKSTFIEALGLHLVAAGHRLAVLAVDPSSTRSGGSILGDKTRMERLSRAPQAFIRPSPSAGTLGGVARRTREVIRLVEVAGFDTVLVETVGVGQSETMVAEMTDIFLLLLAPAGGDELQGVKRGIMEIADLILINKADGALEPIARATRADYHAALHLLRRRDGDPDGVPDALCVSALSGAGLADAWSRIDALFQWRVDQGWIERRRADQASTAFARAVETKLLEAVLGRSDIAASLATAKAAVRDGQADPESAAAEVAALVAGTMRQKASD